MSPGKSILRDLELTAPFHTAMLCQSMSLSLGLHGGLSASGCSEAQALPVGIPPSVLGQSCPAEESTAVSASVASSCPHRWNSRLLQRKC